ncbi:MAG: CehA/McbA family metallohydrolase [Planctomycetales bacterium]|nr:CehA/McbA family metallohydrolase [Planctomycetales bacterium]
MMRATLVQATKFLLFELLLICNLAQGQEILVREPHMHHLRATGPREWSEFPEEAASSSFDLTFEAQENQTPYTLQLRQQDVKQRWMVLLNDLLLGELHIDENDMVVYFEIPARALLAGKNQLRIEQGNPLLIDDILVGEVAVLGAELSSVIGSCTLAVEVVDEITTELLPSRVTVLNEAGAMQTVQVVNQPGIASRPGTVYTATGVAQMSMPAGRYEIYAGRGFEYSLASAEIQLAREQNAKLRLGIRREVPTPGLVACDTHVHTRTHSGHGDATVQERMVTLAAEGIELPIATDHNVNIDHRPFAAELGVSQYFTPVIGNEVTTTRGHFNVFPIAEGAPPPNHRLENWQAIFDEIYGTPGVRICIMNHGRDIHSGFRPLGHVHHNSAVGENVHGWQPEMNAMEVLNSSATQTNVLQLCHDWMTFLNRGRHITPIGCSDSHDVARHFVGQGRTYIRCDDGDVGAIDIAAAMDSLVAGRVLVSYGLLTELVVDGQFRSGDLATVHGQAVQVQVRVLAPHWVHATTVSLFVNGQLWQQHPIPVADSGEQGEGIKWEGEWSLQMPAHDVHLVAVATGPGIEQPYWRTAKPYQPMSPEWNSQVMGCSGAIWLDVDGDGRKTSAYEYALKAVEASRGELSSLLVRLASYDRAVAAQAACIYQTNGNSWLDHDAQSLLKSAPIEVQAGVRDFLDAWRSNQMAESE